MQFRGQPQPLCVVYNTSMSRPDAALALAALYGYEGKREARLMAVAVNDAGLDAAIFCDLVVQFYTSRSGRVPDSNRFLPIGLAAKEPLPGNPAFLKTVIERRDEKGELAYPRSIRRVADTSEVAAMLRNSLTGVQDKNGVMILSAPATDLDRALALPGVRELVAAKVKTLVVCETSASKDPAALRRVLAAWPTAVVLCGLGVGEALAYPAASIEKDFAWATPHPVVDAYKAFQPMPYDAKTLDLAAVVYAVHPELGFFDLSEPGTISVADDGKLELKPAAGGKHRSLTVAAAKSAGLLKTYVDIASLKAERRPFNFRPPEAVKPAAPPPPAATPPK